MSTNPFRRSSLKGPGAGGRGIEHIPNAPSPIDIPNAVDDWTTPLTVNTKASVQGQKHVNFASPPAIPISPISYPDSPESTRISPNFTFARPTLPSPIDYSGALQSDPFPAGIEPTADDSAIEQALRNAKANTTIVASDLEASKQDAVKNTLSKFASAPKRPVTNRDVGSRENSTPSRQTMDVDAFKRLLLTGDSGSSSLQHDTSPITGISTQSVMHDNSSTTDTASISQRSIFDQGLPSVDSPRSSSDIDPTDAESIRRSLAPNLAVEGKKKPPPPAPRHGKPIKDEYVPTALSDAASSQTSLASGYPKKPPTPPLARRRSHNSAVARPGSSRQSSSSEIESVTNLQDTSPRAAPPPPRSRRPVPMADRRSSSDLPTTVEEPDATDIPTTPSRKSSDVRPAPPPARNSSKRVSIGTMNPPPLPPPRRNRGSSRSSVDSQRPTMSVILGSDDAPTINGDTQQLEVGSRKMSASSNATDILADLAALQREVDEARRRTSK